MTKTTELMEAMLKRALAMSVRAKCLLMDSWFSTPSIISTLRSHIYIICMLKDHPKWLYEYRGKKLRLRDLYSKLKKKPGRAKIKANVLVKLSDGQDARIIFVPSDKKRGWPAILSTDTELAEKEIARQYGKRWDIEVFFKMCKQHLKLVKEIRNRDFDGLIGHTSMVLARYNLLAWFQLQQVDQRSFGDLFRFCKEEMENIKFIDALKVIMQMAMATICKAKSVPEKIIQARMDAVMGAAIIFLALITINQI